MTPLIRFSWEVDAVGYNIGPTIAVKGEKEYATAMKNIRAEMKQVKAAAEAATSAYSANDRSIKALVTRNNELKKAYDVQEKAVIQPRRRTRTWKPT